MKKILAFAGSNSSSSINKQLVTYVASMVNGADVSVIDLNEYALPMYGIDIEQNEGFPDTLVNLLSEIKSADGLLIAVNEHNGSLSAFFKNIIDWLTRIDYNFLEGKRIVLMSTSPGKRGGLTALEYISDFLPRIKAEVIASIAVPSFNENFSAETASITNQEVVSKFQKAIEDLLSE